MKKKIASIFLCTMLIATVIIPVSGAMEIAKNQDYSKDICPLKVNKPDPPIMNPIEGPSIVMRFKLYFWSFTATDLDSTWVTIYIFWGDGTFENFRARSGINYNRGHIYSIKNTCNISAFAIDNLGDKSNTENFTVFIKSKTRERSNIILNNVHLVRFIELFLDAFPILCYLFGV